MMMLIYSFALFLKTCKILDVELWTNLGLRSNILVFHKDGSFLNDYELS